jgi:hypothetical protein
MKLMKASIGSALLTAALIAGPATGQSQVNGLIVLHETTKSMVITGDGEVIVPVVRVNSSNQQSLSCSGTTTLASADVAVVGGYLMGGGAQCTSDIVEGAAATSNPLAALPAPAYDPSSDLGSISISGGTASIDPGYYSGGIKVQGGNLLLRPGIYILDGDGLDISGTSTKVKAHDVLLYMVGSGSLSVGGGGSLELKPMTDGAYSGMSLFQASNNTAKTTLTGGSGISVSGVLYMPSGKLVVTGNGDAGAQGAIIGGFVIASAISVSGTGLIYIGTAPSTPVAAMMFD